MTHDDFASEPVRGLPERPPEGEKILWQGRPHGWWLTWDSLSLPWVAGYFAFLTLWRFATVVDQVTLARAVALSVPFVIMGAIVIALLFIVGYIQARTTVYTITNRRVAMRIGAALTVTLNLPFRQIANADLRLRKSGAGSISLETLGETQFSYLILWPHLRPGHVKVTKPALRCIPDAAKVADILAEAAEARVSQPVLERKTKPTAPQGDLVAAE